jgi:hypothetical protein
MLNKFLKIDFINVQIKVLKSEIKFVQKYYNILSNTDKLFIVKLLDKNNKLIRELQSEFDIIFNEFDDKEKLVYLKNL